MSDKENKVFGIDIKIWIVIINFGVMLVATTVVLPWLLQLSPNMEGGAKLLTKNNTKLATLAILIIIGSFLVLVKK